MLWGPTGPLTLAESLSVKIIAVGPADVIRCYFRLFDVDEGVPYGVPTDCKSGRSELLL